MDTAQAGKHVLCEKPLGMTEDEMMEMDEVMRRAGLQLFTGFNYRFSQSAIDIQRLVQEKGIGEARLSDSSTTGISMVNGSGMRKTSAQTLRCG